MSRQDFGNSYVVAKPEKYLKYLNSDDRDERPGNATFGLLNKCNARKKNFEQNQIFNRQSLYFFGKM